jgi:hypothetical protein
MTKLEELKAARDSRKLLLLSVGAILGTLPTAVPAIISYFVAAQDVPAELGLIDFIQIILFCSGVFVAVCTGIIFKKNSKRSVSLRDQIRNRTKDSRDT